MRNEFNKRTERPSGLFRPFCFRYFQAALALPRLPAAIQGNGWKKRLFAEGSEM